jgi:hypothetical protein
MLQDWMVNKMRSHPDWLVSTALFLVLAERVLSRSNISAGYICISVLYCFLLQSWFVDETIAHFAVIWRPLTIFSCQWVLLTKDRRNHSKGKSPFLQSLSHGGPLGRGCWKILEVVIACILWKYLDGNLPGTVTRTFALPDFSMALSFNGLSILAVIIVISVAVNGVLNVCLIF